MIRLNYSGRILTVWPPEAVMPIIDNFSVRIRKPKTSIEIDPVTGEVLGERVSDTDFVWETQALWWYDTLPEDLSPEVQEHVGVAGTQVLVTYSGYGQRIEGVFHQNRLAYTKHDSRPNKLTAPDFNQVRNMQWRGSQADVLAVICASRGGIIRCPTGWGKSHIIRALSKIYTGSRIVVTVPSRDVADDFYRDLSEGGSRKDVGMVGAGKRQLGRQITVAVTHSVQYCDPNTDIVFLDEVHSLMTDWFIEKLQTFMRARMFGFSATVGVRPDGYDGYMEPLCGPILHWVPYQEAVETGNVVPLIVRQYDCLLGPDTTVIPPRIRERVGIIRNMTRNRLIAQAVRQVEAELGPDAQILIMVSKTEHGYLLRQLLPEYVVVSDEVDKARVDKFRAQGLLAEGEEPCSAKERKAYKKAFETGELKRAIATFVWSKGVDFVDLACLVRADGLASKIQAGQVPGRLSRLGRDGKKPNGLLIDFYDMFSPDFMARSATRFKEYLLNGWPTQTASLAPTASGGAA